MIIDTNTRHYVLECPACGWSDAVSVRGWPGTHSPNPFRRRTILDMLSDVVVDMKLPKQCPKCKRKLNRTHMPS